MRGRVRAAGLGFVAVAALAAGLVFLALGGGKTDAAHPTPAPSDRLVVLSRTMPTPSSGTHLNAQLVSGSVPASGSDATVLDDLDCAPDASGISHCHNPLQLADGRRVEVIHPHSMAVVPCLTRGEHVRLVWQ